MTGGNGVTMRLPAVASGAPTRNVVHHVSAETLLAALPDGCIDAIVTSPPYDSLRKYSGNWTFNFEAIARESYRVLKPGGVLVWVVGDATVNGSATLTSFRQALYFVDCAGFRMHQRIIWEKNSIPQKRTKAYLPDFEDMFVLSKSEPKTFNPVLRRNWNAGEVKRKGHSGKNGFDYAEGLRIVKDESVITNVWKITVGYNHSTKDYFAHEHPAIFPEALAERHILTWTNPGDLVLDYFGGSGTTAKMARANDRDYLTCDISGEYCDLMRRRLAQPYTRQMFAAIGE
jgi:site-specific DNA-methyltransferase (adenine-specific)